MRTQWTSDGAVRVQELVHGGPDWERVLELARRHRLRPLLLYGLLGMGVHAVPAPVLNRLQRERRALMVHSLLRARELLKVMRLFREHGLEALAFKGPVLGQETYGDVGLRPFGDLDLLLRRADLLRAKALLCAEGYRPDPVMNEVEERAYLDDQLAYRFIRDDLGVEVELHWALAHRRFAFRVDTEAVWERARHTVLGGDAVRTLGLEDLLVFLCAHGAKHEWSQLLWVCDVAGLLCRHPNLDGARVLSRAADAKSLQMLRLGLVLASRLFHAPLSPDLLSACRDVPAVERLADQVVALAFRDGEGVRRLSERLRFQYVVHDDWHARRSNLLQVLRLAVTPSTKDRTFVSLPEGWGFLYYLLRPLRIVHEIGRDKTTRR